MARNHRRDLTREIDFVPNGRLVFIARPLATAENGCVVEVRHRRIALLWHHFEYRRFVGKYSERWLVELPHWLLVQLNLFGGEYTESFRQRGLDAKPPRWQQTLPLELPARRRA